MTAILLFGMARLVIDLQDYADLWVDEGWTVIATQSLPETTTMIVSDVHPPLYFYLLSLWRSMTGSELFALRYFSVLAVLMTAVLVYRLGGYLYTQYMGLVAALFYVLHDLVWVLGREVRQYPFMQLIVVLTVFTYWRFWQKPQRSQGVWFVVSAAAVLWTNYWGGLVLVALLLHGLLTKRRHLRAFILAFVAVGISFIPWLPVLYSQLTNEIPQGIGHALPASMLGYQILAFQLLGRPELLWLGLVLVGGLGLARRRWWWPSARSGLLLLAAAVPVLLSVGVNLFYPTLSFRALSVVLPILALLIAHAITRVPKYSIIPVVLLAGLSFYLPSAQPPERLPWRPIADYVTAHSKADTGVLIETWFDTYAFTHYLQAAGDTAYLQTELQRLTLEPAEYETFLQDALSHYNSLWVVRFSPGEDVTPRLTASGYEHTGTLSWPSNVAPVEVLRFDRTTDLQPEYTFGGTMQLLDYTVQHQGTMLNVDLLWSAAEKPAEDYIVSVFVLDMAGQLITQHDAPPLNMQTTTWNPEQTYFDAHMLTVLEDEYQVGIKVYWFTDMSFETLEILLPDDCERSCEFIILEGNSG